MREIWFLNFVNFALAVIESEILKKKCIITKFHSSQIMSSCGISSKALTQI